MVAPAAARVPLVQAKVFGARLPEKHIALRSILDVDAKLLPPLAAEFVTLEAVAAWPLRTPGASACIARSNAICLRTRALLAAGAEQKPFAFHAVAAIRVIKVGATTRLPFLQAMRNAPPVQETSVFAMHPEAAKIGGATLLASGPASL